MGNKVCKYSKVVTAVLIACSLSACGGGGGGGVKQVSDEPEIIQPTPEPTPDTPTMSSSNYEQIGAATFVEEGYDGTGVTIGLIDSGLSDAAIANSTFNINKIESVLIQTDPIDGTMTLDPARQGELNATYEDGSFSTHGETMAMVIGGENGVAKGATINHYNMAEGGYAGGGQIFFATNKAIEDGAKVINTSYGFNGMSWWRSEDDASTAYKGMAAQMLNIIENIKNSNSVIVRSLGNGGEVHYDQPEDAYTNLENNPEVFEHYLLVMGVDRYGKLDIDSDRLGEDTQDGQTSEKLRTRTIMAPFHSDTDNGGYTFGTSGAAANVSAGLALMASRWESTAVTDLAQILLDTADKTTPFYDLQTHGQGLMDLNAAFTPIGETTFQVEGASLPIEAVSIALPAGFGSATLSASFLDSYGRDFQSSFLTKELKPTALASRQFALLNQGRSSKGTALKFDGFSLSFSQNNLLTGSDKRSSMLGVYGLDSAIVDTNITSLKTFSIGTSDYAIRMSSNGLDQYDSSKIASEDSIVHVAGVSYKGLSIDGFALKGSDKANFYGSDDLFAQGLQVGYEKDEFLFGASYAIESSKGTALVKNWNNTTTSLFVRFDGKLNDELRYGISTAVENSTLGLDMTLPKSVGNGKTYLADESLSFNSQNVKVSAYANFGERLKANVYSDKFDSAVHLSYTEKF